MGDLLVFPVRRRPAARPLRRPFSWGLLAAFLLPVGGAIAVLLALTGCAEKPVSLQQGAPASESYPQVQDQCEAQPWLAWCAADAERRQT